MLSVIVPIYNVEKYLRQCLDSIVSQTYEDLQIILVNDGSTDNSMSIIREFADKDNRIIIVNKKNGGLVSAYVAGYEKASGDYITFVDSDDWIEHEMYTSMMNKFAENNIDLVICAYDRVSIKESNKVELGINEGIYSNKQLFYYGLNKKFISAARWNKIYKKELLDIIINNIDFTVNVSEDLMVTIPYVQLIKKFYYIDKIYYHYRLVEESISKRYNELAISDILKVYNCIKRNGFDYDKQLLTDTILELYIRLLKNIFNQSDADVRKNNYKKLINEPLFKNVKMNGNWNCKSKKDNAVKLMLQCVPMTYFKIVEYRRKKRASRAQ